jgi:hypothetical protein
MGVRNRTVLFGSGVQITLHRFFLHSRSERHFGAGLRGRYRGNGSQNRECSRDELW